MPDTYDVAIVGAGIVGACCAFFSVRRGMSVIVLDRGGLVAGTTGSGEGNILVSDKRPGPDLDLAVLSTRLWRELAAELSDEFGDFELEEKGGLVVAGADGDLAALLELAAGQSAAGVRHVAVDAAGLPDLEPHINRDLAGGVYYPGDLQVQPAGAVAAILAAARTAGARLSLHEPVLGADVDADERVIRVETPHQHIRARQVVNAAGPWAANVPGLAGFTMPVSPRRGYILVTEPVGELVRHKVYTANYVDQVASDDAGMRVATVVEGTPAGTILIGSTRDRVGFNRAIELDALRSLASGAVRLFPVLRDVRVIRAYHGFRPFSPDHLPLIGADPTVPGLFHAHGHEGAGIGLAPATGYLIAELLAGDQPSVGLAPFDPARFFAAEVSHATA
ncbi:MAG TPA: FAD-binding oxidoreductase [Actinoplanes sp.]|jgi:glycine/D-amino acid oxidase-like deaminating enzyme|nr:FAD-binding oxidoreductase [Actinoplanes sp.]